MSWGKGFLSEGSKLILAVPPIDTNGAAQNGLWAHLKHGKRARIAILVGNQAGLTPNAVTLEQATDNAGAGGKALAFDWKVTNNAVALDQTNDAMVRAAVTSNTFNLTATDNSVYIIDIRDTMLDIANGFTHFRVAIASPGAVACPIAVIYDIYDADWSASPSTLPSAVN